MEFSTGFCDEQFGFYKRIKSGFDIGFHMGCYNEFNWELSTGFCYEHWWFYKGLNKDSI